MSYSIKSLCLAAGITAASTMGASAALLDFTESSNTSGSIGGGINWSLSATGGAVNANTDSDAQGVLPVALALNTDGVGVGGGDDEVTNTGQTLTLSFTKTIFLQGVHFLDLFIGPNGTESALTFNDADNSLIVEVFATDDGEVSPNNGYGFKAVADLAIKSITFVPGDGIDTANGDFALAAIDYRSTDGNTPDTVPLPAAGFLLLGALGGLGLARRRKKA